MSVWAFPLFMNNEDESAAYRHREPTNEMRRDPVSSGDNLIPKDERMGHHAKDVDVGRVCLQSFNRLDRNSKLSACTADSRTARTVHSGWCRHRVRIERRLWSGWMDSLMTGWRWWVASVCLHVSV